MATARDKLYLQHAEQTMHFRGTPQPREYFDARLERCKDWVMNRLSERTCGMTLEGVEKITRLHGVRLQVCLKELEAERKVVIEQRPDGNDLYSSAKHAGGQVISIERAMLNTRSNMVTYAQPAHDEAIKDAKDALCGVLKGGGAHVNRNQIADILKVSPGVVNQVIGELTLEGRITKLHPTREPEWYTESTPDA